MKYIEATQFFAKLIDVEADKILEHVANRPEIVDLGKGLIKVIVDKLGDNPIGLTKLGLMISANNCDWLPTNIQNVVFGPRSRGHLSILLDVPNPVDAIIEPNEFDSSVSDYVTRTIKTINGNNSALNNAVMYIMTNVAIEYNIPVCDTLIKMDFKTLPRLSGYVMEHKPYTKALSRLATKSVSAPK